MTRAIWWPRGEGLFLMSEVPLYSPAQQATCAAIGSFSFCLYWEVTSRAGIRAFWCHEGTPSSSHTLGHDVPMGKERVELRWCQGRTLGYHVLKAIRWATMVSRPLASEGRVIKFVLKLLLLRYSRYRS